MRACEPPGQDAVRSRRKALELLRDGWSPEEVALTLGVSVETIERVKTQGWGRLEQAEAMVAGVESAPAVPEEIMASNEQALLPPSAVGAVKEIYRRASKIQRQQLRAWMRRVLVDADGNDGEVVA